MFRFDGVIGGNCFEGYGYVVLMDGFVMGIIEVNGEFFGVVFDDVGDGKVCSLLVICYIVR